MLFRSEYSIPKPGFTTLKVFNLLGQEVATLAEGFKRPGHYAVSWDAGHAPSGVYLYRLAPGGFDTRSLPDNVYELVVTATDIRGNHSSYVQRFSVHNRPGVVGA